MMERKLRNDLFVGIVFCLFAVLILMQVLDLQGQSQELPRLCAYGILVVGISIILQTLVKTRKSSEENREDYTENRKKNIETLCFSLVLIAMSVLIPIIGFYLMIFLFVIGLYMFLARPITKRVVLNGCIFGVSVIIFFFVVFDLLMKLPVPKGLVF